MAAEHDTAEAVAAHARLNAVNPDAREMRDMLVYLSGYCPDGVAYAAEFIERRRAEPAASALHVAEGLAAAALIPLEPGEDQ
jgi:hypothetical protein